MNDLQFTWDTDKAQTNLKKHGVSFEEAKTAFNDPESLVYFDELHSDTEDRFILLGLTGKLRLVVVCHCYRERENLVRLISARKANRSERTNYLSSPR